MLLDKIYSWLKLQKEGAAKLKDLATEMEGTKQGVNVTKVVGSSVSVGAAVAMTTAGVITLCTGGLAIPFLGGTAAVVAGAGLVTNLTADIVDVVASSLTMKEAEVISEKIQDHEEGIQKLMKTLEEEGRRREQQAHGDISPEDYVVEKILRAMAKREDLVLNDEVGLCKVVSQWTRLDVFRRDIIGSFLLRGAQGLAMIEKVLVKELAEELFIEAAGKAGKKVVSKASEGATKAVANMAPKVAAKAVGRVSNSTHIINEWLFEVFLNN